MRVRPKFVRLRPALVETAQAGAAGLDEEGVDCFAAPLIDREAFVNHLALPPADLRRAEGVDVASLDDGVRVVLHSRGKIPDGGKAHARDRRIARLVGEFVDHPGLEAALHGHPVDVGNQLAILHPAKLPVFARNEARKGNQRGALGQPVLRILRVERRVGRRKFSGSVEVRIGFSCWG